MPDNLAIREAGDEDKGDGDAGQDLGDHPAIVRSKLDVQQGTMNFHLDYVCDGFFRTAGGANDDSAVVSKKSGEIKRYGGFVLDNKDAEPSERQFRRHSRIP